MERPALQRLLGEIRSRRIDVSVMRKMITTLNAMLRDGANWQPQAAA